MNLDFIWKEFLKIICEEAGSRVVETWFKAITLSSWDSGTKTVYLSAPNSFVKDWVSSRYMGLLKENLSRLLSQKNLHVIFLAESKKKEIVKKEEKIINPTIFKPAKKVSTEISKNLKIANVPSNYRFDSYVVGPNNFLAFSASKAVAENPGLLYNPLFLYGDSGLGKTHLLFSISNYLKSLHKNLNILYQSADRFVNEFINSIRFNKASTFEKKYKNADILIIDDIQFIGNKDHTQEVFFHIFNMLYERGKQIVFSCDTPPKDIQGIADRLRSRLNGGLVTFIEKPNIETKVEILKKKAAMHNEVLEDDVANFVASKPVCNIRELEGLLIRIIAFSSLTNQPLSLELAQKVLGKASSSKIDRQLSIDMQKIGYMVSKYFDLTLGDLRSNKRQKDFVLARHIAMYLMKKHTSNSLSDIGSYLRRKDHSTVIYAVGKIEKYKKSDKSTLKIIKDLEGKILDHELN